MLMTISELAQYLFLSLSPSLDYMIQNIINCVLNHWIRCQGQHYTMQKYISLLY